MSEVYRRGIESESGKKRQDLDFELEKETRFNISGDLSNSLANRVEAKGASGELFNIGTIPIDFDYTNTAMYFDKLMTDKPVDGNAMTMLEKKRLLMSIGGRALTDYDTSRRDSYDKNRVSFQDFKKNFLKSMKADEFLYLRAEKGADGKWRIPEEKLPEIFEGLSDLLDIPIEDIQKLWKESKDDNDFANKFHEKYLRYGVCRDTAVYLAKLADQLGLKNTFSTSISNPVSAHSVVGFKDENGNIAFIDYGNLIQTDTPNMKLALSVLEKAQGSIGLNYLQSEGREEGGNIIFIKSKAAEVLEEIARGKDETLVNEMSSVLDKGGIDSKQNILNFFVDKERTKIELNLDTIAGTTIISTAAHYLGADSGNSIDRAYSARLAHEYGSDIFKGGISTAYTNIKLKDPDIANRDAKNESINKFLTSLYTKFHGDVKINEHLRYKIAAMTQLIVDAGLDNGGSFSSYQLDFGAEHRLYFITSNMDMYVGFQHVHSLTTDNLSTLPKKFDELSIVNDLLSTNLGMDFKLGEWAGYKVNFDLEGKFGSQYLKAFEYSGKAGLKIIKDGQGVVTEVQGKYVDSSDFRINEYGQIEGSVGYITPVDGGTLKIRGYGFDNKTKGEFKDSRLDEWGVGFNIDYNF